MKLTDAVDDLVVAHSLLSLLYHSRFDEMDSHAFQGVYHLLNDAMERLRLTLIRIGHPLP